MEDNPIHNLPDKDNFRDVVKYDDANIKGPVGLIHWLGRTFLIVAGRVVVCSGDVCRDPNIMEKNWSEADIIEIAEEAERQFLAALE